MTPMDPDSLTKADRLAIGGAVAPVVRRQAAAPRKVTLVGKDGKPTGTTTAVEVAKSLLARAEIEFSVQEGKRPEFVSCKTCGRPVKVPHKGVVPRFCPPRTHMCACGKPAGGGYGGCAIGKLCRGCNARRNAALGRARAKELGKQARPKMFTDDQLRAAAVSHRGARAIARAIGVGESSVRSRARELGISLADGRRTGELPGREQVVQAVAGARGNVSEAARTFGLVKSTLERHITALGLREWLANTYPAKERIRQGASRAGKARWRHYSSGAA